MNSRRKFEVIWRNFRYFLVPVCSLNFSSLFQIIADDVSNSINAFTLKVIENANETFPEPTHKETFNVRSKANFHKEMQLYLYRHYFDCMVTRESDGIVFEDRAIHEFINR